MWCVDSEAAFKCNGYRLESLLAGHLNKGSVHRRERLECECKGTVYTRGSAQCGGAYTGGVNSF